MQRKKFIRQTKSSSILKTSPSKRNTKQLHPFYSAPHNRIMHLQKTIGNQAVGRLLSSDHLQAKPEMGDPIQNRKNRVLSEEIQSKIESSFGQDFSNVAIQKNSQKASDLNSLAFTQGDNIHFAPGQFNPKSEKGKNLIGHEFTHIVQQRNGVVRPTALLDKGFSMNEDKGLESEAHYFGKKAVRGEPVAKYQPPRLGSQNFRKPVHARSSVIQRAVGTKGGTWDTEQFAVRKDIDPFGSVLPPNANLPQDILGIGGVDIILKFTPNKKVNAEKIGLIQSAKTIINGVAIYKSKTNKDRSIQKGPDQGTHIDRQKFVNNPIYNAPKLSKGKNLGDTPVDANKTSRPAEVGNKFRPKNATAQPNSTYQLGHRIKSGSSWSTKDARLYDGPTVPRGKRGTEQVFETAALAVKGNQTGTYYGSVKWGWKTDSKGDPIKIKLTRASKNGIPSSTFKKVSKIWNRVKDSTGADPVKLP